ncbi:MAG: hypothetical protein Q9172_004257 [Xanthocarpia lactea]
MIIMKQLEIQTPAPIQIRPAPPRVPKIALSISQKDHGIPFTLFPENVATPTSATRQDLTNEFKVRGAGKSLEAKRAADPLFMQADATMASPIEVSRGSGRREPSETFEVAFSRYTQSIVDFATGQVRCDSLMDEEQQQRREHVRWLKYSDNFPAIGEDQTRNLKATERARNQLEMQINEAKQESEKAINAIARTIFASSISSRVPNLADSMIGPAVNESTGNSEEVIALNERTTTLQDRHKREIADLRSELLKRVNGTELKLEEKIAQESARIKMLTDLTTKQESIKADLEKLSASKLDNLQAEIESEVEKRYASMHQSLKTDIINELQPRITESIRTSYQPEFDRLSDSVTAGFAAQQDGLEKHIHDLQAKTTESIMSKLKPEFEGVESLKSAVSTSSSAIATLQSEVKQLSESVYSIEEYHTTVKIPIHKMMRDTASREEAVKKVVSQQEEQSSKMQRLDERFNDEISKPRNTVSDYHYVRSLGEHNKSHFEVCKKELHAEQDSLKAQMEKIEKTCEQLCGQLQASSRRADSQTPSTVSEAQAAPLDQRLHRMDCNVRNLVAKFNDREKVESDRDEQLSLEISQVQNYNIELEAKLKMLAADTAENKDLLNRLGASQTSSSTSEHETWQQLDQLRSDQLSTSAVVQGLQADMARLNESAASNPDKWLHLEHLESEMSILRTRSDENLQRSTQPVQQALPQVNGVIKHEEVQPKIEALESKINYLEIHITDKVKAVESILASHGSRFNNMTTEPIVTNVIQALKHLYPLHALQINHNQLKQEVDNFRQDFVTYRHNHDKVGCNLKQQILDAKQGLISMHDQAEQTRKQGLMKVKQELTLDIQGQTQKIGLLEKRADVQAKDQYHDIEKLRQDVGELEKTMIAARETMEQNLTVLKDSLGARVKKQLDENESLTRKLDENIDAQNQKIDAQDQKIGALDQNIKDYMKDALNEVRDIDLRVEDLEATNASSKGDTIPAEVGETQGTTMRDNIVEITSEEGPVKHRPKRSRDNTLAWDGSTESPPQKRKRGRPSKVRAD